MGTYLSCQLCQSSDSELGNCDIGFANMGSSVSSSSTKKSSLIGGSKKKTIETKLETAHKTGVINMADMDLKPTGSVWTRLVSDGLHEKIRTLDISGNNLKAIPVEIHALVNLKNFHASRCSMQRTSDLTQLSKLVHLELNNNDLEGDVLRPLPTVLKV